MKTRKPLIIAVASVFVLALILVGMILLSQPAAASYERHVQEIMQMEQTDLDSPISGIRTGLHRNISSLGSNEYECTDNGIYYISGSGGESFRVYNEDNSYLYANYLFYCDHDSNQMIKLCGRPDCTHDTFDCNAVLGDVLGGITYYDQHLYFTTYTTSELILLLWRMDPDGNNREQVTDCYSANNGTYGGPYDSASAPFVQNGVFGTDLVYFDENAEIGFQADWFYTKLDGKVKGLSPTQWGRGWNDGFSFLSGSLTDPDGQFDGNWHLYNWDPDTNTEELLVEVPEYIKGYWGENAAYVFVDGAVQKVNYPDGSMEVLFDTSLSGDFITEYYPDCIVMLENKDRSPENPAMMYFYSWEGEKLGEVEIGFNRGLGPMLFGGESKDRIMLRGSIHYSLPEYYIEKSDFGTGHIEIHKFEYPDLDEETYSAIFGED